MDRDRFDELARGLATRATRRTVLGILSALGIAGATGIAEDGAARKKRTCKQRKRRCGGKCCKAGQYCRDGRCQPRPYAGGCLPEQNACLSEPNFCPDDPTERCVPLANGMPVCGERFCSPCTRDAECVPQTGSPKALCIPSCALCQDLGISDSACVIPAR